MTASNGARHPVLASLLKRNAALRGEVARLRLENERLRGENLQLATALKVRPKAPLKAPAAEAEKVRLTPDRITFQRKRLGLSPKAYARLLGVQPRQVRLWEKGVNEPAPESKSAIVALMKKTKTEVWRRLDVLIV